MGGEFDGTLNLLSDAPRGCLWIACAGDGTAYNKVAGAGPNRIRRSNHAGLVGGVSTCDQVIIKDMKPNEDGLLNGTITDPTNGKVYTANMRVDDEGALRLRGYVGVPWLGQTRVWKPVKVAIGTNCHFTKK